MQQISKIVLVVFLLGFLVGCPNPNPTPAPPPVSAKLQITPVLQQTLVWCWAASAQMVLGHYNYPSINPTSPQCGIIAAVFGGHVQLIALTV